MRVLEVVSGSLLPMSLAQLSQRADIPKATLARLVAEMTSSGYLSLVPGRRELIPGPRATRLSMGVLGNGQFRRECRAVLREVVGQLGETCNLTVRDGDRVMYIERVETQAPLRLHLEPGVRAPLHCTAGGKLFLAQMEPAERERFLGLIGLESLTPGTITDRAALGRELDRIRKLGYGVDNEEFVCGMVGIAVPLRLPGAQQTVAALVCHAAAARSSLARLEKWLPVLRQSALQLADCLGKDATAHI